MTEYDLQKVTEAAELVSAYCDGHQCYECPFALLQSKDLWYECIFTRSQPDYWHIHAIGDNINFYTREEDNHNDGI